MLHRVTVTFFTLHVTSNTSPSHVLCATLKSWAWLVTLVVTLIYAYNSVPYSFEHIFGSVNSIRRDIGEMKEKLCEFNPQIGFCHNDLSHANLIYNQEEG